MYIGYPKHWIDHTFIKCRVYPPLYPPLSTMITEDDVLHKDNHGDGMCCHNTLLEFGGGLGGTVG